MALQLSDAPAIIIDTREREYAYEFEGHPTEIKTLKTGDYSISGLENLVAVERKELDDFIGCVTSSRDRFQRELERAKEFVRFYVIIEGTIHQITKGAYFSKVHPNSVIGSIAAWQNRFGAHFIYAGDRETAQRMTKLILQRTWLDDQEGKFRLIGEGARVVKGT